MHCKVTFIHVGAITLSIKDNHTRRMRPYCEHDSQPPTSSPKSNQHLPIGGGHAVIFQWIILEIICTIALACQLLQNQAIL